MADAGFFYKTKKRKCAYLFPVLPFVGKVESKLEVYLNYRHRMLPDFFAFHTPDHWISWFVESLARRYFHTILPIFIPYMQSFWVFFLSYIGCKSSFIYIYFTSSVCVVCGNGRFYSIVCAHFSILINIQINWLPTNWWRVYVKYMIWNV